MKQSIVTEVSDILDIFNLDEISQLLSQQIESCEDSITTYKVDHFKPLYYKYKRIMEDTETTGEMKEEAKTRFMNICNIFLKMICNKFHLEIDSQWKEDHYEDIPGFTMALYSFFAMDLVSNVYDVCLNYISKNTEYIYETFEERKNKKDASTLVNKKLLSPEIAIIVSNIYDVTTWILNQISEEQYLDYLNPDYLPLKLISGLFQEGIMSGEFMDDINEIYNNDVSLKSDVCFKIISKYKVLKKDGE